MTADTLTHATIKFLMPTSFGAMDIPVPGMSDIEFAYNPKEYSVTRSAEWAVPPGKTGPEPEYSGPRPSQITVEVFLDSTDPDSKTPDISEVVKTFMQACNPVLGTIFKDVPKAPFVKFIWGTKIAFKGYIESVAVKYTLFRHDGTPVRGTVTLTIKELKSTILPQNPTSGGEPGTTQHHVVAGDTLASIAYREYGAAGKWRVIANANPAINDPLRLRPGTTVIIPPA